MPLVFGIEEEGFIINKTSLKNILFRSNDLRQALTETDIQNSSEVYDCQIELKTSPHNSFETLENEIISNRKNIRKLLNDFNCDIYFSGSLPDFDFKDSWRTPKDYYLGIFLAFGLYSNCFQYLSTQFHVSNERCKDYKRIFNILNAFDPIFLNLSASSPFSASRDTHHFSSRFIEYRSVPVMLDVISSEIDQKNGDTLYSFYGTHRITPYGSLEMRVCDSLHRVDDLMALLALYASLFETLLDHSPNNLSFYTRDNRYMHHNTWYAAVQTTKEFHFKSDKNNRLFSLNDILEELVDFIKPTAKKIGAAKYIEHIFNIYERGNGAEHQCDIFKQTNSFYQLKNQIINETHDYLGK
ncbi:MAG: hypothetical protein CMF41_04930 [Legionellales bacterium]|nr:hypothetical protein [Legionellales bacterium]